MATLESRFRIFSKVHQQIFIRNPRWHVLIIYYMLRKLGKFDYYSHRYYPDFLLLYSKLVHGSNLVIQTQIIVLRLLKILVLPLVDKDLTNFLVHLG